MSSVRRYTDAPRRGNNDRRYRKHGKDNHLKRIFMSDASPHSEQAAGSAVVSTGDCCAWNSWGHKGGVVAVGSHGKGTLQKVNG